MERGLAHTTHLLGALGALWVGCAVEVAIAQPVPSPDESSGASWIEVGPPGLRDLTDAAIHPELEGAWAVVAASGAVWYTPDAGASWREILGPVRAPLSSDEARLLDAQGRLGELLEGSEPSDPEALTEDELEALEDELEAGRAAAEEASAVLLSELEADPWSRGARERTRSRVRFSPGGDLLVARSDGLLLQQADHLGEVWAWSVLLDTPVSAVAPGSGPGALVIGTPEGVFRYLGPHEIVPLIPELAGVRIHDLIVAQGLHVASEAGLWLVAPGDEPERIAGGVVWTALPLPAHEPAASQPATLIARPQHLGLAIPGRLERPVADLVGVRAIASHPAGGWIAASAQGPSRSAGGVSWGPPDAAPAGTAPVVASRGGVVLWACASGLYRLGEAPGGAGAVAPPAWIPLGVLLAAGLERPELQVRAGSRGLAAAAPLLTVSYQWRGEHTATWDLDRWSSPATQGHWLLAASLTWRTGPRTSTELKLEDGAPSVFVIGDALVVDDGSPPTVLSGRLERGAVRYREQLAQQISSLYRARQGLAARGHTGSGPLLERVALRLGLDEVEAQLDVLTRGAVSAAARVDPIP